MANFTNYDQFAAAVAARLNKPPRYVEGSEGITSEDVKEAILAAGLRMEDVIEHVNETNSETFIQAAITQIEEKRAEAVQVLEDANGIKSEIISERTLTQAARVAAENAVANAALGQDPKGEYNASTNTPALTATPDAGFTVGAFYTVTVAGNAAFAGSNFASGAALAVGGRLIKKDNTAWYYQPPSNLALTKAIALENKLGGNVNEEDTNLVDGNAVWESQRFLREIEIPSAQLFDKNTMQAGNYTGLGVPSPSNNWIRTPLIKIDPLKGHITGSGWGMAGSTTPDRFFFYGAGGIGNFISKVSGNNSLPLTAEIPANAHYVAVNVANAVNIGLNPTASPYAPTFMLNYGEEVLDWNAYGYSIINESLIPGLTVANLALSKTIALESKLDGTVQEEDTNLVDGNAVWESQRFLREIEIPSAQLFDKNTMQAGNYTGLGVPSPSNNWIRTPLIKIDPLKGHITGSGWGTAGSTTPDRFFFYGAGGIGNFISKTAGNNTLPLTAAIPANAHYVAAIVANAVNIGLNPTASPYAATLMVNYGEEVLNWDKYGASMLDSSKLDNVSYPDNFFTYLKTGASGGNERFIAYTKLSRNLYAGFNVDRITNLSELEYSDNFRITRAYLYSYNGSEMVPSGVEIIYAGESECVYLVVGRADFTGGLHGDEVLTSIAFLADNQILDISSDIPLTPANTIEYRQTSTMHETAATGDIVNPLHPIEAIHHKITTFEKGGYTTRNRLIWQQNNIPVSLWYHGIACIHKNAASVVQNDYLEVSEMVGDNINKITKPKARSYFGRNSSTRLSAKVSSVLLKPEPYFHANTVVHPDNACTMFVWDRPNDSKYYRRYNPATPITAGEEWESEMSVSFKKANL